MKHGLEYADSPEKRAVDVTLARLASPAMAVTNSVVSRLLDRAGLDLDPVLTQSRIGQAEEPFDLYKFRTTNPATDEPLGKSGVAIRRLGLNELAQLRNIREGSMSAVARRPLVGVEYEQVMDNIPRHLKRPYEGLVANTKTGIWSSYGLWHHTHSDSAPGVDEFEMRAELDLKDFYMGSPAYDFGIVLKVIDAAVSRRLR